MRNSARVSILFGSVLPLVAAGALSSCSKKETSGAKDAASTDAGPLSVLEASAGVSVSLTPEEIRERMLEQSLLAHCDERPFDRALLGDRALFRHRVEFVRDAGSPPGLHLRFVNLHPGDRLYELGFRSGDELTWVNGFTLAQPSKVDEVYVRLRTADHLEARIERDGGPMALCYGVTGSLPSDAGDPPFSLAGDDWSRYAPVRDAPPAKAPAPSAAPRR